MSEAEKGNGEGARDPLGLETRLRRLEEIVSALEADEVDLERALTLFEEGVAHVRGPARARAMPLLHRVEELLRDAAGRFPTLPFPRDKAEWRRVSANWLDKMSVHSRTAFLFVSR